jgi:hypothetical protein
MAFILAQQVVVCLGLQVNPSQLQGGIPVPPKEPPVRGTSPP